MKKLTTLLLTAFMPFIATSVKAQNYDQYFEDATLRIDYIFAGNAKEQHIYLQELKKQDKWAGRKSRLAEKFLNGNGQVTVKDHATGQVIYVTTFSTLFQEWMLQEEAQRVDKAFETSYNVPFPKQPVDVTVTLTDNHQKVVTEMTHAVDPKDILIRKMGNNSLSIMCGRESGRRTTDSGRQPMNPATARAGTTWLRTMTHSRE